MLKDIRFLAPAYLAAHLFLDWVSFIHELSPLNITPWNPPSGLIMGMLIVFGFRTTPLVWLGLIAADIVVRGLPVDLWATLVSNTMIAGGYAGVAWLLRNRFGLDPTLAKLRDIVLLLAGAAITPLVIGSGYIATHMAIGLFPWPHFPEVLLRYWIGEFIGITVLTPFVLIALRRPSIQLSWIGAAEASAQGLAIAFTLWLDFGPLSSTQYEHFYLLFLPAIWIAVRHGLPGAAMAAVVTQGGLIVAVQVAGVETARMTHFQLMMLTLAITTLLLGAVVSERRRVEAWIRERQSDFAHASRLSEAGEMAAALAHELNQPLAATMSYARAARKIAQIEAGSLRLTDILDKTVAQAERADRVIRSLREFVHKGQSRLSSLSAAGLIADCLTLASPLTGQHGVAIAAEVAPGLAPIFGDAIQLQQVILNLVRNAAEAMDNPDPKKRRVVVFAHDGEPGYVIIGVRDTGPGLASVVERNLFSPFFTTKATGMGLGLSIARTIVENHGGVLISHRLPQGGTVFQFTIPSHENDVEDGSHAQ